MLRCHFSLSLLASLALLLTASVAAGGTVLYEDDFEGLALGDRPADFGGAIWTFIPNASTTGEAITDAAAGSGNFLHIEDWSDTQGHTIAINDVHELYGNDTTRRTLNWRYDFYQKISTHPDDPNDSQDPFSAYAARVYVKNRASFTTQYQAAYLYWIGNPRVHVYDPQTAGIERIYGTSFSGDMWVTIDMSLDLLRREYAVKIWERGNASNVFLDGSGAFDASAWINLDMADRDQWVFSSIQVDTWGGSASSDREPGLLYYDNYHVEVMPEPSSLVLLGLAGSLFAVRRRW
jgi:hypothetical protein